MFRPEGHFPPTLHLTDVIATPGSRRGEIPKEYLRKISRGEYVSPPCNRKSD